MVLTLIFIFGQRRAENASEKVPSAKDKDTRDARAEASVTSDPDDG